MNTSSMTEADWAAALDAAVPPPTATPAAPPPPPPKVKTADEIVAEEQRRAVAHHAAEVNEGAATMPRASGTPSQTTPPTTGSAMVFADQTPAAAPTALASDSPELVELRGIHAELKALGAMLAVAINKLGKR